MSIVNTYVHYSTEKSAVILQVALCLFLKENNWGDGVFLLKESLTQDGSSQSLLTSLVASVSGCVCETEQGFVGT